MTLPAECAGLGGRMITYCGEADFLVAVVFVKFNLSSQCSLGTLFHAAALRKT
jgi:hypothetical protein